MRTDITTGSPHPVTEYMTPADFAAKVAWEGGIEPALDYGLKHTELNPDDAASAKLRTAWAGLETAWREHFKPASEAVETVLEELEVPVG